MNQALLNKDMKCYVYLLIFLTPFGGRGLHAQTQNWFPLQSKHDFRAGEIGLADWLNAPAGKHGFVTMKADKLVFEDGIPVKFWGVNIGNEGCYPKKGEVDSLCDYWSKFGINAVRLHKFTWDEHKGDSSTVMNNGFWQRFDYFQKRLREKGIYTGW